jgi:hypothetical protein
VTFDVDAHDEELAQRFEAMAEKERVREALAREEGHDSIAALRSTYAHAWVLAAKMLREDIARRARCGTVAA